MAKMGSVHDLLEELENFCESDELTLERLRERIRSIPPDALKNYDTFLHDVCTNTRVSLEIVEFILGVFPGAASMGTAVFGPSPPSTISYPLHMACSDPECPNSVIALLVKKNSAALSHLCIVVGGADGADGGVYDEYVKGTPLHYYLAREANIDIETVKMLVDAHPAALTTADEDSKFTPLHTFLCNPNSAELCDVLQFLVEYEPISVRMIGGYGETPLHMACTNKNIQSKTVQVLLNAWPESSHQRNDYGFLPVHSLCSNRELSDAAALDILNLLLKINPQSVAVTNDDGELPIHLSVGSKSPKFCKVLIDAYLEERNGDILLLNYACSGGRRVDTVKYLFELYPESINVVDEDGFLPIHRAAQSGGAQSGGKEKAEIISFLLSKDPDGAEKATAGGSYLPLHLACEHDINHKTVQLLFDAYPEAIHTNDGHGRTPLDYARELASQNQNNSTVVNFLEAQLAFVRDMSAMNTHGWLPLHHALYNNASLGSIKLLVRGNPAALQVADYQGILPLCIACEFSTADVVQFLVEQDSSCLNAFDENNNSPLHHACREGNCGVIKYLLDRHVPSVSERNAENKLPIHLLCEVDREKVDHDSPEYVETIWLLLLAHPEAVLQTRKRQRS